MHVDRSRLVHHFVHHMHHTTRKPAAVARHGRERTQMHRWCTFGAPSVQLHAAGCAKVCAEKVSGAKTDRPELAKLIRRLEAGDVLMVTHLDRLARSTHDLLNILDAIGKARAGFKSLSDAWADTTTPHGRLMLTILGGLAEFERELILARTGDGRARAKAKSVRFGRPAEADAAPAAGGPAAPRRRRDASRCRADLQRGRGHDR
jgi:DNA invertase Pin-like site-specific DNA recombinase